jgi:hypothetical protein
MSKNGTGEISAPATESRQNHREAIEASWMEMELLISTSLLNPREVQLEWVMM